MLFEETKFILVDVIDSMSARYLPFEISIANLLLFVNFFSLLCKKIIIDFI